MTNTFIGMLRQPSHGTGFGSALNIETLVAAAERRDTQIEVCLICQLYLFRDDKGFLNMWRPRLERTRLGSVDLNKVQVIV